MNRKFFILLLAVSIFIVGLFCGCAQDAQKVEDPVTYALLSEEEQALVDFIYEKRGKWNSSECGSVGFTQYDEKPCLVTFSVYSQSLDGYSGWRRWYTYNLNERTLEEYDSKFVSYSGYTTETGGLTTKKLLYNPSWDNSWSESEAKDYIAQKYDSYLNDD